MTLQDSAACTNAVVCLYAADESCRRWLGAVVESTAGSTSCRSQLDGRRSMPRWALHEKHSSSGVALE